MIRSSFISFVFILAGVCLWADFEDPKMSAYYNREVLPLPAGEVMEPGSIALLPDDRVLVGTRRGELWICEGPTGMISPRLPGQNILTVCTNLGNVLKERVALYRP